MKKTTKQRNEPCERLMYLLRFVNMKILTKENMKILHEYHHVFYSLGGKEHGYDAFLYLHKEDEKMLCLDYGRFMMGYSPELRAHLEERFEDEESFFARFQKLQKAWRKTLDYTARYGPDLALLELIGKRVKFDFVASADDPFEIRPHQFWGNFSNLADALDFAYLDAAMVDGYSLRRLRTCDHCGAYHVRRRLTKGNNFCPDRRCRDAYGRAKREPGEHAEYMREWRAKR